MNFNDRIGFMQGRLSPLIEGRIQSFPWDSWQEEFEVGRQNDFSLMEWTLDQERLQENPLMTEEGRAEISTLSALHGISIPSLTGDCFMQAPFWKADKLSRRDLLNDFQAVIRSASDIEINYIVIPLVDNGSLSSKDEENTLVSVLQDFSDNGEFKNLKIIFESDFGPQELARFIGRLDKDFFGINYDIGNSAALGFLPKEEFEAYGERVLNVHIKDRALGGTTVPLGEGDADFDEVFSALSRLGYMGNYILQTARAVDSNHAGVLCTYRDMMLAKIN